MLTAKQVKNWAEEYDSKLLATDPRFRRCSQIIMEDGTVLFFKDCFLIKRGEWLHWFSEHYSHSFVHLDDIIGYQEFEPKYKIEELKI